MPVIRVLMSLLMFYLMANATINIYKILHPPVHSFVYTDSDLIGVVRSFDYEARQHLVLGTDTSKISVIFGDVDDEEKGTIGECSIYKRSNSTLVTILKSQWDEMDNFDREQLIFHELGHCVLNRDHCNAVDQDNKGISIMNEYLLPLKYYQDNRDDLIQELFHADPRCK